jgi:hypothetical protein
VAENCSFEHFALGSSYSRLCRQLLIQTCNKNVSLCLRDLHSYAPFLVNISVARSYDGSLSRTILPLAPAYVRSSPAQVVKRRSAGCLMCLASAQPGRMHCLPRQPSQQPSVSFLYLPRSVVTLLFYSRHYRSRSRVAFPKPSQNCKSYAASPLQHARKARLNRFPRQNDPALRHSVAQIERLRDPHRRHIERNLQGKGRRLSKAPVLR